MKSRVYYVPADGKESPDALALKAKKAYLSLDFNAKVLEDELIALKIHFGEKHNTGYVKPQWLTGIAHELQKKNSRAFLTDSNTLYVGHRSNSVDHIRLAWSHGFRPDIIGLPVIIADGLIGRDDQEKKSGHARVKSAKIGGAFLHSDALLCLTHVTGHIQTGVGASIKNMGMGCASRAGKLDQHSVVHPRVNPKQCRNCSICFDYCPENAIVQAEGHVVIDDKRCIGCGECLVVCRHGAVKLRWDDDSRRIQEKLAEYALSVQSLFRDRVGFLNFLIHVTKDCDCLAKDQPAVLQDIGILASSDAVAVDKASVDLIIKKNGGKDVFRAGYDIDWSIQFSYGESIGLGRTEYELVEIS